MESKEIWREFARRQLPTAEIEISKYVSAVASFLADSNLSGAIVTYSAMRGEVDLSQLVHHVAADQLCLTRTPEEGYDLSVHVRNGQPLERHRFGFDQPAATAQTVADSEIAVVLVPGLLFDQYGGRLGRGMGYYDRFLGRLGNDVVKVGITHDVVVDTPLPLEAHDVMMSHLASSDGVAPVLAMGT